MSRQSPARTTPHPDPRDHQGSAATAAEGAEVADRPRPAQAQGRVDLLSVEALVRPAVEYQGYELVEVTWTREQGHWICRVTIDRRPGQGYISHEDCVNVSHEVSALLDVHEALPGAYHLEVSSPGVNRPLKKAADFARFLGQRAKIRMKEGAGLPAPPLLDGSPAPPRRNFVGTILAVDEASGVVQLRPDDAPQKAAIKKQTGTGKAKAPKPAPEAQSQSQSQSQSQLMSDEAPQGVEAVKLPVTDMEKANLIYQF